MKCISWNITSLAPKLFGFCPFSSKQDFISFVKNYDIICFQETWGSETSHFLLDGYQVFASTRKPEHGKLRNSGGVLAWVKDHLLGVQPLRSSSPDFLWLFLPQTSTGLLYNVILGVIYMAPSGSKFTDINLFDSLEEDFAFHLQSHPGAKGCLVGDFNAYTSTLPDHIPLDSGKYGPDLPEELSSWDITIEDLPEQS
jgi:exonuclease III